MNYFFLKLVAPRADFMQTMNADELELMKEHGAYLKGLMEKGWIGAFGPVAAPDSAFGMALATLAEDVDPQQIVENDPTIRSGTGFSYEVFPMPRLTLR